MSFYFIENGEISLDQCLNMFTEPEVLSPDEAWLVENLLSFISFEVRHFV